MFNHLSQLFNYQLPRHAQRSVQQLQAFSFVLAVLRKQQNARFKNILIYLSVFS